MFFLLSKVLAFLVQPIVWILAFIVYSFFSKIEKNKKRARVIAGVMFLFFSNAFILDETMRSWEIDAVKYESLQKPYEVGIVLGGILGYDQDLDRLQFYRGADRLWQAVELYKMGKIKKILFVGGSGDIRHPELKEGRFVLRYLQTIDIPERDILIENESKNTRENALFTKAILDKAEIKGPFLLITSATHMRRSLACFEKAGLQADAYSTDRYTGKKRVFYIEHLLLPNVEVFRKWDVLIHEWVGMITYKLAGYI